MDDLNNPYHSPGADDDPESLNQDENVDPRTIGKARQVPTVAILMIVHGVFMFFGGCCLIAMMVFVVPQMTQQVEEQQKLQRQQNPNMPQLTKDGMQMMMYGIYGGIAVVLFIIGVVNVIAGMLNYGYRHRVFGVISLVVSMGSVAFCWCLPLSLGLLIYGMIIYLSPEAERAFRWRSSHPELN